MASIPACKRSQKLCGSSAPPGKRQPRPMIAIGSRLARSRVSSLTAALSRALSSRWDVARSVLPISIDRFLPFALLYSPSQCYGGGWLLLLLRCLCWGQAETVPIVRKDAVYVFG